MGPAPVAELSRVASFVLPPLSPPVQPQPQPRRLTICVVLLSADAVWHQRVSAQPHSQASAPSHLPLVGRGRRPNQSPRPTPHFRSQSRLTRVERTDRSRSSVLWATVSWPPRLVSCTHRPLSLCAHTATLLSTALLVLGGSSRGLVCGAVCCHSLHHRFSHCFPRSLARMPLRSPLSIYRTFSRRFEGWVNGKPHRGEHVVQAMIGVNVSRSAPAQPCETHNLPHPCPLSALIRSVLPLSVCRW